MVFRAVIQIIVFPSSSMFLPVCHCFRGCSKINLKNYDVINCLSKNLVTHFIRYLGKKKRCDIEILSIDRVLNTENFYGKIMQKYMHQKLEHFLILVSNPKQLLHAIILLKIQYFQKELSKSLKKVNFIFSFEPNHF